MFAAVVFVLTVFAFVGLANYGLHNVWVAIGVFLGVTWELSHHYAKRERELSRPEADTEEMPAVPPAGLA